jgi:hypothetical protein
VAQPLIANAATTVGAPSFAHVAKGGYRAAGSEGFPRKHYATLFRKEISPHPSLMLTGPASPNR